MAQDFGKLNFSVSFNPTSAFPLDSRSYFESIADAQVAAATAQEVGNSTTIYYYGQTIVVVENNKAKFYIIQPDKTLKPIGEQIAINENVFSFDENGKLDLYNFSSAVAGAQLIKDENGKISWIKPDNTIIEGLSTDIENLQEVIGDSNNGLIKDVADNSISINNLKNTVGDSTSGLVKEVAEIQENLVSKANSDDVYTKVQVDGIISSTYRYKGTVKNYASLPINNQVGDVYNIKESTLSSGIRAGDNVAWNGTEWDVLAGFIDLSDYATKDELPGIAGIELGLVKESGDIFINPDGTMAINKTTNISSISTDEQYPSAKSVWDLFSKISPKYGVRFEGSANTGATVSRLYNAVGLVAGVGTDTETARNDFDNIYPWSDIRRCCGYWGDDGNFVINAYKGEPGYAVDGSNGEVWVEIPLFYYKHAYTDGAEEIIISATQLAGFLPAPIFLNTDGTLRQKAYIAAYLMAMVDGKPTSRSGVFPENYSLNSAMENARKAGANYTVTTSAECYTISLLMWVEFATRDMQSIMKGAISLPYSGNCQALIAEESVNRINISRSFAENFIIGQVISIGTIQGVSNIAENRFITSIEDYDANTTSSIYFDGEPINVAVGNKCFSMPWQNGSCDNVITSSGSPISNSSGKYNCMYRGIERIYGNSFEYISDILSKREGTGTDEDPYTYDIYFLPDPTKYAAGAITADYVKLNYSMPSVDGFVKTLGLDSRYPWVRIPNAIGASETTYYSDEYRYPLVVLGSARMGGSYDWRSRAGRTLFFFRYDPGTETTAASARLSYHY